MTVVEHRRLGVAAYAALISLSAWFGSIGLTTGLLPLSDKAVSNLPFDSVALGGAALGVIVALPTALTAWLALSDSKRTATAAVASGLLLTGWIVGEVAIIREFSPLQVIFAAAGIGLMASGRPIVWHRLAPVRALGAGHDVNRRRGDGRRGAGDAEV